MEKGHPKSVLDRLVLLITSVGGLGYLPLAPGTWGTLGALPIYWALAGLPLWQAASITVGATLGAIGVSHRAEAIYGGHDVQHIVIDEVVGLMWSVLAVPWRWQQVMVAFVLFRLLDAYKPWPISVIDREVQGGLGVVLDDVAAGIVTCLLMHGGRMLWTGWW